MFFLTSRFKNKLMKFKYINIQVNIEAIENICLGKVLDLSLTLRTYMMIRKN